MNEVTVILTSCGRFDLLERTLDSFFKFNSYDIAHFHIYEDGGIAPFELENRYPFINWYSCATRKGQIEALDFLWKQVQTPYAFTLEDDWQFTREGFIEASMAVLEDDPEIIQVWLTGLETHNKHPIYWPLDKTYGLLRRSGNLWSGHRFNPALKRKADYDAIAPFSKWTTFDRRKPWKSEATISQIYHKLGFKAAILRDSYMVHIGQNRHVT